jgi:hypothetical protein
LLPLTGYSEAYAVPASAGAIFSLKYTTTNTAGATIKFNVTDPTGKIEPDVTSAGRKIAIDDAKVTLITIGAGATDTISITDQGLADVVSTGDLIKFDAALVGSDNTSITALASANKAFQVTVAGAVVTFTTDLDLATENDLTGEVDGAIVATVLREARSADNSYVIDTGGTATDGTAANRTRNVVFLNLDGAANTRSATVQGWTDDANLLNGQVDSSESLSAARTIQFVKVSEITASTTLTNPNVGDVSLAAKVTTTPLLNGDQLVNNTSAIGQGAAKDFIRVLFTRQDSTVKVASDSAVQSTVDGSWSASVSADVSNRDAVWTANDAAITATAGAAVWGFTAAIDLAEDSTPAIDSVSVTAAKVVTVNVATAHFFRTGDLVTVASADVAAIDETEASITVISATSFTYKLTTTDVVVAVTDATLADTTVTMATYGDAPKYLSGRVFSGTHSAQALINTTDAAVDTAERYTATGSASTLGTLVAASADIRFTTVGTETLQGSSTIANANVVTDAVVKVGALSATVTATVLDADGDAVGAGRSVAFTIARSNSTIKVNNEIASGSVVTDLNGQATFTVTDTLGLAGSKVTITAIAEGVATATSDVSLEWEAQSYGLIDLNTTDTSIGATRTIVKGSSYDLALLVADQWNAAPAADTYRVLVSGSGVTEGVVTLTSGMATVKVSDNGVSTSIASKLQLQKKNATTGVFADEGALVTLTTTTTDKGALTLGADGTSLYGSTVDLSDLVAAKALVERDTRSSFVALPVYTNDVVVSGKATNSTTGANLGSSVVTVSGPSSILFVNGSVEKRGTVTLVADGNGEFTVTLYSTTAQTDSVITVTANGVSKTTKVSFTGAGVGEGTSLVVTMPAAVKPASTFQVKAKLADAYGNGVNTAAGRVKVTYTGAGIVFGTLPTETDANGELMFSVLLGSNDTGSVNVTVSYDQNADLDFVDAKDLNTSGTTAITASGVASSETKVNVGSFKGYVALYAKGYAGQKMSAIVAGKWIVVESLASDFERVVRFTGAGYTITTKIYIDGVQIGSEFTTVTK